MKILKVLVVLIALAMAIMVCTASTVPGEIIGLYWEGDPTDMHYYAQLRRGWLKETVEVRPEIYDTLQIGSDYID